jgi:hypothetical protein
LAQLGAGGAALGGVFDTFVSRLLPHHEAFLGAPPVQIPAATADLVLLLLRTVGFALVAVGLGALALLAVWRRGGPPWSALAAAGIVALAEGTNAWAIRRVGSPLFFGPLAFALLTVAGVALVLGATVARGGDDDGPGAERRSSE